MIKNIHVHLIFEKKDYYFGSIPAVYSVLDADTIGMKLSTLQHAKFPVITKRAIIKAGELIRSTK